ncbi:MAG: beta-ketoacyl synthase N-terminal-like domain-containing protein, partial [Dehalococcoidia bacterium]
MKDARSETGQQAEAVSTEVDKQIDDLLSSIGEEETVEPTPKARPKRAGKGKKGRRRVVVTGMGAITPLGLTVDEYWQGLIEGRSGVAGITLCDVAGLTCQIAGEVKGFNPRDYLDHKEARRMARFSQFVVASSKMAIEDAGLNL